MPLGAIPENRDVEPLPKGRVERAATHHMRLNNGESRTSPALLWEPPEIGFYPVVGSLLP